MKQRTVKRAVEALNWLHNNPHHIFGTDFHPTKKDKDSRPLRTHLYFQNHQEKMRIPEPLIAEVFRYLKPNKRKFDTRMYALTAGGIRMVT